jgi:hypothetical protein
MAQQQLQEEPTPSTWKRTSPRRAGPPTSIGRGRSRAAALEAQRRVERGGEQRDARIGLRDEPDRKQRDAEVADLAGKEPVQAKADDRAPCRRRCAK